MFDHVLPLTDGRPARTLAAGEVLYAEGDPAGSVVVLVEGDLVVEAGGVVLNRHTEPGTIIGETGALLRGHRTATVTAAAPTVLREIGDPNQFFAESPELGLAIARQMAGRLHRLTAYITDVQRQFGDRDDHLGMFGELLGRISSRLPVDIDPGSDRAPDY